MKEYWAILDTEEIKKELTKILTTDRWIEAFCVNGNGEKIKYSKDSNTVASFSEIGTTGTIYNETIAIAVIYAALSANTEIIANWIKSKEWVLRMTINAGIPIGYVIENDERHETSLSQITLRRAVNDTTKYGFYVAAAHPQL